MGVRLRLFERIPYLWAMVFATALAVVQLFEHTDPLFICCCFVYILIATAAFNIADGLTSLAGNFVFANAVLTCIIGITTKAVLGEPGQSHLKTGTASMEVYVMGMLAMLAAAIVERRFRPKRAFIPRVLSIQNLDAAYFGCAIVGVAADLYYTFEPVGGPGTVSALFSQLNRFTLFAIILGTIRAVRKSGGRFSISASLLGLLIFSTVLGILSFSKEGIIIPSVAWLVGLFAAEYRIKATEVATFAIIIFVIVRFGVPFSQFGRAYRPESGATIDAVPNVIFLLKNFDFVDSGYAEAKLAVPDNDDAWSYFDKDLGQLGRLTMLPPDDTLIAFTDRGHLYGYGPTIEAFENWIPHFIWKDKPTPRSGNIYWHELGLGPDDDESTGISFSPTGDAYHQGGLAGVLLVEPLVFCFAFLLWSFFLGGTRQHPANLIVALLIAHSAPEGSLGAPISQLTTLVGILFIAWCCRYVFPIIGSAAQKQSLLRNIRFPSNKRPSASANGPLMENS